MSSRVFRGNQFSVVFPLVKNADESEVVFSSVVRQIVILAFGTDFFVYKMQRETESKKPHFFLHKTESLYPVLFSVVASTCLEGENQAFQLWHTTCFLFKPESERPGNHG